MTTKKSNRISRAKRAILTIAPGTQIAVKSIQTKYPGKDRDREFSILLRSWKTRLRNSGNIIEAKTRQEFIKPSVINRRQRDNAIRLEKFARLDEN